MARRDRQFQPLGNVATPASWVLPSSLEIVPKAITAVFDGSGAGSAFLPTLEIVSDSGQLVARVPTDTAVAAGGSAEVTFAPFLRAAGAAGGVPSLPTAFIERNSGFQTLTANNFTSLVFDTFTTNNSDVFLGLDVTNTLLQVAEQGEYLLYGRIEFGTTLDGTHDLSVDAQGSLSRGILSDFFNQRDPFSRNTRYPLVLDTYSCFQSPGNPVTFAMNFLSVGATFNGTGQTRLQVVRLGDLCL